MKNEQRDDDTSWMKWASCHGMTRLFFPTTDKDEAKGSYTEGRVAPAKEICARCPVEDQCLAYALRWREPHGIWGGRAPAERGLGRIRRSTDGSTSGTGLPLTRLRQPRDGT